MVRWLRTWGGVAVALMGAMAAAPAGAQDDKACAIVLMHGKWGNPQYISFFGRKMEPTCVFKSLELPWAQRRAYDEPYETAIADIAAQVKTFRDQGYRRVLLAGHSFGANAAMAYMATRGDADGVIALAPGHSPANMYERGIGRDAVDQARERVAAGQGSETLTMEDLNQGQRRPMRMKAAVLLSYFDPKGLGDMPSSAAAFKRPVPFLWVIGTGDPLYRAGPGYAFAKAPAHPASRYLEVQADHAGTPDAAAPQVLDWIKSLP
jgi:dienelactone hydrolase